MFQSSKQTIFSIGIAVASTLPLSATACGTDPFIGEICLFPYNFCPRGFAATDGQLLSISQNTALFSLLGTTYGGNGQTTFALPDLRGRVPVHVGQGPGLSDVALGEQGGSQQVTLNVGQLPAHTHTATSAITAKLRGTNNPGTADTPAGNVASKYARTNVYSAGPANVDMGTSAIDATATTTIGSAGGNQPFENRQPYLGLRYCIALQGIFPSRD
jgi:microcystin-dependent protein